MKKRPYDKNVYRSFTLVMQFGLNMLVPICMLTAAGVFLDKRFGTSFWTVLLFFIGAVAGGQNIYRMAKKFLDKPSTRQDKESSSADENNRDIKKDK